MRVAFFFGSGISIDSKAASVKELTNAVCHGKWIIDSQGRIGPARGSAGSDKHCRGMQAFLLILESMLLPRLKAAKKDCTYEDLFAAVTQLDQDERQDIISPLISPFSRRLRLRVSKGHLLPKRASAGNPSPFATLTSNAMSFIQWIVFHTLIKAKKPVKMAAISGAAKKCDRLDIFSLNHDLLIEAELRRTSARFSDGFEDYDGDVRVFNGGWDSRKVRLYKLHGSVNWVRAKLPDYTQFVIPRTTGKRLLKAWDGRAISLLDNGQPSFLTGTTVKEQAYGTYLIGELFYKFRHVLTEHRRLIVCGYGWQDRGINHRLEQWLGDQRSNKMLILHGGRSVDVIENDFWATRWNNYAKGRLQVFPKFLNACSFSDFDDFLKPDPAP
jgi:hypothetical protein